MAAALKTPVALARAGDRAEEARFPLGNIKVLHKAIRQKVSRILCAVDELGPLSPDAHLLAIAVSLEVLEDIVLEHCKAENDTLLPALNEKTKFVEPASETVGSAGSSANVSGAGTPNTHGDDTPPAKRPRSSPACISVESCEKDHILVAKGLNSLRNLLQDACNRREPEAGGTCGSHACIAEPGVPTVSHEAWLKDVKRINELAGSVAKHINAHMDGEERIFFPLWKQYFSPSEQGPLLVEIILRCSGANWPRSFGYLEVSDLSSLFDDVAYYASDEQLSKICTKAAPFISNGVWKAVCAAVPKLLSFERPTERPLIETALIRRALRNELKDLVPHCRNLNITCKSQLQSFTSRFTIVDQMYSFLSDRDEKVILVLLKDMVANTPLRTGSLSIDKYEQDRRDVLYHTAQLNKLILSLAENVPSPHEEDIAASPLVEDFSRVSELMISHLEDADNHLEPQIDKYFGVKTQEKIVSRIMGDLPDDVLHDTILWMFDLVLISDVEALLRCIEQRLSQPEFERAIMKIVSGVKKGTIPTRKWTELGARFPELQRFTKLTESSITSEKHGPVSEILRVHKAIRVDMHVLLSRTQMLPVDGSLPNPRTLNSLAMRVDFLRRMVHDHAKAEDDILLPRLEKKKPGSTNFCEGEHDNERVLFCELAKCLRDLECVTDANDSSQLVWRLRVAARTLRDEMVSHLAQEEKHLWPLVKTLFNRDQQKEIVALIFGNMPSDRLRELLPWMIRVLSVDERNEMMGHILEVTSSTMFEKWLKTWLPHFDEIAVDSKRDAGQMSSGAGLASRTRRRVKPRTATPGNSNADSMREVLQHGRQSIQEMVKEIAQNDTIDMATRTRLMQDVMLAPFTERQEQREVARNEACGHTDNLEPTYKTLADGTKVLGCKHYQRAVKIRATCCGKLYTCRLCHDEHEESHVMDRYATEEILCMFCNTLQPVGGKCINPECGKSFAKYFCRVCRLYDDDENKSMYHCHSCNVCRIGKGLGIDWFHCMKCNQCMSIKFQDGHTCVENAMESGCPVCYEYLFTSTRPVKALQCGHLMHEACFKEYSKHNISCPVCKKSLAEMDPVYKRITQMLERQAPPAAYQNVLCDTWCNDCNQRSNSPFHFMYQQCQLCKGYNTRILGYVRPPLTQ